MSRADEKLNPQNGEDLEMLFSAASGEVDATPPEGLLERLLNDIPQDVSFEPILAEELDEDKKSDDTPEQPANDNRPRYWLWSVAAGLILAVGLGSVLLRNVDSMGPSFQVQPESAADSMTLPAPATVSEAREESLKAPHSVGRMIDQELAADADDSAFEPPVSGRPAAAVINGGSLSLTQPPGDGSEIQRKSRDQATDRPDLSQQLDMRMRLEDSSAATAAPAPEPLERKPGAPAPLMPPPPLVERPKPQPAPAPMEIREEITVTAEPYPKVHKSHSISVSAVPKEDSARSSATSSATSSETSLGYSGQRSASARDRAFQDNFFESVDTNPFIDTEDDRLSTFGLDVDTGSYGLVREFLSRDALPPREAVRVEEMLNYFDYGDLPPEEGEGDFAFSIEGAPSLYGEGERYYMMRIGIKGREVDPRDRKPALLTFVIDVSGSMEREDRLGLVKESLSLLIDQLKPRDRMALVVYGTRGRVLLEPTSNRERIRQAINALHPEGSTNAGEGLQLAYELAAESKRRGEINRIILCSDGVANVGKTTADEILEMVRDHAQQGVELTTVGFGMGNYNDILMEQLADRGNGRYAYVDSISEARRIFVENLTGTLQTIAAEARAQVEMNPILVSRYRLLGYENRDIADERFRDDTVDAGEIGAGHTVTVLYELKTKRPLRKKDQVATVHLRYASMAEKEMVEQKVQVRGRDFASTWNRASSKFRLAASVGELAEILRQSYWARDADPRDLFIRLQKVAAEMPGDTNIAELATLAGKVADLEELRREKREGSRRSDRE